MKINFRTDYIEGHENIMCLGDINPSELRFNTITRQISIVYENDKYTLEDLDGLSWQALKSLVIENDGKWESKKDGIKYLVGREKCDK